MFCIQWDIQKHPQSSSTCSTKSSTKLQRGSSKVRLAHHHSCSVQKGSHWSHEGDNPTGHSLQLLLLPPKEAFSKGGESVLLAPSSARVRVRAAIANLSQEGTENGAGADLGNPPSPKLSTARSCSGFCSGGWSRRRNRPPEMSVQGGCCKHPTRMHLQAPLCHESLQIAGTAAKALVPLWICA